MPNFNLGTDQGTLESHPLYDSPFSLESGGPYKVTYNGFIRPNTGIYDRDGTGDSARNAWHFYLQNLDLTVSRYDCSDDPVAGSVATRDADGALHATNFIAADFSFGEDGMKGIVSGGAFL